MNILNLVEIHFAIQISVAVAHCLTCSILVFWFYPCYKVLSKMLIIFIYQAKYAAFDLCTVNIDDASTMADASKSHTPWYKILINLCELELEIWLLNICKKITKRWFFLFLPFREELYCSLKTNKFTKEFLVNMLEV